MLRVAVLLSAVSATVFAACDALPGDAADTLGGGRVGSAGLDELRAQRGLTDPLWLRWLHSIADLAGRDGGHSLLTGRPVYAVIGERLPATLVSAGLALAGAALMCLIGCLLAGRRAVRRPHTGPSGVATALAAVPQPVVAAGLTALFAGGLALLPPVSLLPPGGNPLTEPRILILPVLTIALPTAAFGTALLAGAVADALSTPHAVDARLRGVPAGRILRRHVAPALAVPALRVLAVAVSATTAGTALAESTFGYAGAGELLVTAVATRDTPVVHALAVGSAIVVLGILLIADLIADPIARREAR
ncbi:ABC transporter permease [Embleya sp. NPDC005971]|uniref:ABC transporter permease n=1 Tax=unclassified Embleya TaxID=2699296 RepID=UPI0033DF6A99